jgi:hypothetical protein
MRAKNFFKAAFWPYCIRQLHNTPRALQNDGSQSAANDAATAAAPASPSPLVTSLCAVGVVVAVLLEGEPDPSSPRVDTNSRIASAVCLKNVETSSWNGKNWENCVCVRDSFVDFKETEKVQHCHSFSPPPAHHTHTHTK